MALDPHLAYTVPRAHVVTKLPRGLLYDAVKSGELKAVQRGSRYLIGGASLIRFVESLGDGRETTGGPA
jgi:hypothetical protein